MFYIENNELFIILINTTIIFFCYFLTHFLSSTSAEGQSPYFVRRRSNIDHHLHLLHLSSSIIIIFLYDNLICASGDFFLTALAKKVLRLRRKLFGVILKYFCGHFQIILGSYLGHFKFILGSC